MRTYTIGLDEFEKSIHLAKKYGEFQSNLSLYEKYKRFELEHLKRIKELAQYIMARKKSSWYKSLSPEEKKILKKHMR